VLWKSKSIQYAANERPWRRLAFLIKETSKLDSNVSPTSDVLEISMANKIVWLQRTACK